METAKTVQIAKTVQTVEIARTVQIVKIVQSGRTALKELNVVRNAKTVRSVLNVKTVRNDPKVKTVRNEPKVKTGRSVLNAKTVRSDPSAKTAVSALKEKSAPKRRKKRNAQSGGNGGETEKGETEIGIEKVDGIAATVIEETGRSGTELSVMAALKKSVKTGNLGRSSRKERKRAEKEMTESVLSGNPVKLVIVTGTEIEAIVAIEIGNETEEIVETEEIEEIVETGEIEPSGEVATGNANANEINHVMKVSCPTIPNSRTDVTSSRRTTNDTARITTATLTSVEAIITANQWR